MKIIDYDNIEEWAPLLTAVLEEIAPKALRYDLVESKPEFLEDAEDFVVRRIGKSALVTHLNSRLADRRVRLYHGTRLDDIEVESVRAKGLNPLKLIDRSAALRKIFRNHPRWGDVEEDFESTLQRFGSGNAAGLREDGCVHVCFSRAGLLRGCSHYLAYGAEVDSHIARALFNDGIAQSLLQKSRTARLISFVVPFPEAASAANPHGVPLDDLPALLSILLRAWAYKQVHPAFTVTSQADCTAARFPKLIAARDIEAICDVQDAEINMHVSLY